MEFQEEIIAEDGSHIILTLYAHASVGINWKGINIYVDPAGEYNHIDFSKEPKADIILVTHHHKDHLDLQSIKELTKDGCEIFSSKSCGVGVEVHPFETFISHCIQIEAVPAYNITEGHLQYHPKSRLDCGYILNLGGTRIYIAGDTEDNEDILALKNIGVAFLPVNQPYTMTYEQVANICNIIGIMNLFPYHYKSSQGVTDLSPLKTKIIRTKLYITQ